MRTVSAAAVLRLLPLLLLGLVCGGSPRGAAAAAAPASAPAGDDQRPVVDASKLAQDKAAQSKLPTLFAVGDSTVRSDGQLRGWGSELAPFIDPAKMNVVNRATGGRSSRTFIQEGRWDKVLAEIKPGDVVLVQFGHNDAGDHKNPAAKGRPSLKGEGDETAEALKGDGKTTETIHTFGWYLRKYASDAKAKGATVVLCSMVPHKDWKEGKISRGERETFVKWTENAAKATAAQFVDLNTIIATEYERLGPEEVEPFFADKRTHTSPEGAKFSARCVIAGLKALSPDPLANFYSEAGTAVPKATLGATPSTNP